MHHLRQRMHAGVSAPGADRVYRRTRDLRERCLETILYRATVGLRLPAAKAAAFVLDAQCDAHDL